MPEREPALVGERVSEGTVLLRYTGGNADRAAMELAAYVTSLQGWKDYFRIAGELYQSSAGDLRAVPNEAALRIEIVAERRGSYETVLWFGLAIAGGIIGNRADALAVWSYQRLLEWYRKLVALYLTSKRRTSNVDEIVAALESMAREENVMLPEGTPLPDETVGSEPGDAIDQEPELLPADPMGSRRALVERIDSALRNATQPLDRECEQIEVVVEDRGAILILTGNDRELLTQPLTLPPPEGVWKQLLIRFERINRKTGRALIYLGLPRQAQETASYARVVDPAVRKAGNVYMEAFSADVPLQVWARQVRGERGRLNLMWELTASPPEQLALFGPPGSRA